MNHFKQSAFSLPEIAVALTILGILAVLVTPRAASFLVQARRGEAKVNLEHIKHLQAIYRVEHGSANASAWEVGYTGAGTSKCAGTAAELLNPLGFSPKGCSSLRYSYYVRAGHYYAFGPSDYGGKWIYPDCSGGTASECTSNPKTFGDLIKTSDSTPISVCRNIVKYCPTSTGGVTPTYTCTGYTCTDSVNKRPKSNPPSITVAPTDGLCCELKPTCPDGSIEPPGGCPCSTQVGTTLQTNQSTCEGAPNNGTWNGASTDLTACCTLPLTCDNPPAGIDATCSDGYQRVSGKNSDSFTSNNQGTYDTACCEPIPMCATPQDGINACTNFFKTGKENDAIPTTVTTQSQYNSFCCECKAPRPQGTYPDCCPTGQTWNTTTSQCVSFPPNLGFGKCNSYTCSDNAILKSNAATINLPANQNDRASVCCKCKQQNQFTCPATEPDYDATDVADNCCKSRTTQTTTCGSLIADGRVCATDMLATTSPSTPATESNFPTVCCRDSCKSLFDKTFDKQTLDNRCTQPSKPKWGGTDALRPATPASCCVAVQRPNGDTCKSLDDGNEDCDLDTLRKLSSDSFQVANVSDFQSVCCKNSCKKEAEEVSQSILDERCRRLNTTKPIWNGGISTRRAYPIRCCKAGLSCPQRSKITSDGTVRERKGNKTHYDVGDQDSCWCPENKPTWNSEKGECEGGVVDPILSCNNYIPKECKDGYEYSAPATDPPTGKQITNDTIFKDECCGVQTCDEYYTKQTEGDTIRRSKPDFCGSMPDATGWTPKNLSSWSSIPLAFPATNATTAFKTACCKSPPNSQQTPTPTDTPTNTPTNTPTDTPTPCSQLNDLQKCTRARGTLGAGNVCQCADTTKTFDSNTCSCVTNTHQCSTYTCTTKASNDNTLTVDNKGGTYDQNAESICCCPANTPKWASNTCKTTCKLFNNNGATDTLCAQHGAEDAHTRIKRTKYGGAGGANIDNNLIDNTPASFGSNCCALPNAPPECRPRTATDTGPGAFDCSAEDRGRLKQPLLADDPPTATFCCCPKHYNSWDRGSNGVCETTCAEAFAGLNATCSTGTARVPDPQESNSPLTADKVSDFDNECCTDSCTTVNNKPNTDCANYYVGDSSKANDPATIDNFETECCRQAKCNEWQDKPNARCDDGKQLKTNLGSITITTNFKSDCCENEPVTITSSWYYKGCLLSMGYNTCLTAADWGSLSETDRNEFTSRMAQAAGDNVDCTKDSNGNQCKAGNANCCEIPPQ